MAPKIVDRAERQQHIALAAMAVFGERGFDRTRMDDVARAAGVSKGTLYHYFRDKDALLEGAFDALMAALFEELAEATDTRSTSLEAVAGVIRGMLRTLAEIEDTYRFFLEYMLHVARKGGPSERLDSAVTQFRSLVAVLLEAAVGRGEARADLDVDSTAALVAACLDGLALHWMAAPEVSDPDTLIEALVDMVVRAVRR